MDPTNTKTSKTSTDTTDISVEYKQKLKIHTPSNETSNQLKRRRLIKSAALIPAIYTLNNGTARAAISNMRCVQNTKTQPSKLFAPTENRWHNKPVSGITVQQTGGTNRVVLAKFGQEYYDERKRVWKTAGLDPLGLKLFQAPEGTIYEEVIGGRRRVHTPEKVTVDNRGNIRTAMGPYAKGKAVMDSCWHSFA